MRPIPKSIKQKLEVSSVHLVTLGEKDLPIAIASGLLIDYKGVRHVCTVAHALKDGPVSLRLWWDKKIRKTVTRPLDLQPIITMHARPNRTVDGLMMPDFAWAKIDFSEVPLYQELDNERLTGEVLSERACVIYTDKNIAEPMVDIQYGFFGQTMPAYELHPSPDVKFLGTSPRPCYHLSFTGKHEEFYKFKLSGSYEDHKYFKGCSGAPIVDMEGNIVALVCGGDFEKSEIYGLPIKEFMMVLELSASGVLAQARKFSDSQQEPE